MIDSSMIPAKEPVTSGHQDAVQDLQDTIVYCNNVKMC